MRIKFSNQILFIFLFLLTIVANGQIFEESIICTTGSVKNNEITFNATNFTITHSKGTDNENLVAVSPWKISGGNTIVIKAKTNVTNITKVEVVLENDTKTSNWFEIFLSWFTRYSLNATVTSGKGTVSESDVNSTKVINISQADEVKSLSLKPNYESKWKSIKIYYTTVAKPVVSTKTVSKFIGEVLTVSEGTVIASNNPKSWVLGSDLPVGISFNSTTGIFSGAFANAGTFNVNVAAKNDAGESKTAVIKFIVSKKIPTLNVASSTDLVYSETLTLPAKTVEGLDVTYKIEGSSSYVTLSNKVIIKANGIGVAKIKATTRATTIYQALNMTFQINTKQSVHNLNFENKTINVNGRVFIPVTNNGVSVSTTINGPVNGYARNGDYINFNKAGKYNINVKINESSFYKAFDKSFVIDVIEGYNKKTFELVTKLTDLTDLTDDGEYLITDSGDKSFLGDYMSNSYFTKSTDEVVVAENKIYSPASKYIWSIKKGSTGYTISRNENSVVKYLGVKNTSNNNSDLIFTDNKFAKNDIWELAISSSNIFTIKNVGSTSKFIKYNPTTNPNRFAGYTTSNSLKDLKIYKYNPSLNITIWNGTTWSNGIPDSNKDALLLANLNSATSLKVKDLYVSRDVVLESGASIAVAGMIKVENESTFTLEDGASINQINDFAVNVGDVIVKRNSKKLSRYEMMLWSSPVEGQNVFKLSPKTLTNRFLEHNEIDGLWYNESLDENSTFGKGKSIIFRTPNDFPSIESGQKLVFEGIFKGKLNNGKVEVIFNHVNNFNAVGNPYPSPISLKKFFEGNTNVQAVYIWSATNQIRPGGAENWEAYTAGDWANNKMSDVNLNTATGFLVKMKANTTSKKVVFNNSMRVLEKNALSNRGVEDDKYWLSLYKGDEKINSTLIAHLEDATDELDDNNEATAVALVEGIFTMVDSTYLRIQSRAPLENQNSAVKIAVQLPEDSIYKIELSKTKGSFANDERSIYLKDKVLGTIINLTEENSYSFTSNQGLLDNRFEIIYSESTLAIEPIKEITESIKVYTSNKIIYVDSNELIGSIKIYDFSGRLIGEKMNVNQKITSLSLEAKKQNLIVITELMSGTKISKKILLR